MSWQDEAAAAFARLDDDTDDSGPVRFPVVAAHDFARGIFRPMKPPTAAEERELERRQAIAEIEMYLEDTQERVDNEAIEREDREFIALLRSAREQGTISEPMRAILEDYEQRRADEWED